MRPHWSKCDDGRDIREGILTALRSVALPMLIRGGGQVQMPLETFFSPRFRYGRRPLRRR
jgi:hypothetical protein